MSKRALITGITGQDGFYLSEFLHKKGYEIYGLVRRSSRPHTDALRSSIMLIPGDLLDLSSLIHAVEVSQADEIYNLAGFTHVGASFNQPVSCFEATALGAIRLLEAVRMAGSKNVRYYQASSSEMFGNAEKSPQHEETPFHPRSPYGVAKLAAHAATVNYREAYGLFASCGILFNHESPRRGPDFVTRKIAQGVARIKLGLQEKIVLGNLNAYRDWGFAGDYVRAMWMMLQQETPQDYVIATGHACSVGEFAAIALEYAGLCDRRPWHNYIDLDPALQRPADIELLVGNPEKALFELRWHPEVSFERLVAMMVESELADASRTRAEDSGFNQESAPGLLESRSR